MQHLGIVMKALRQAWDGDKERAAHNIRFLADKLDEDGEAFQARTCRRFLDGLEGRRETLEIRLMDGGGTGEPPIAPDLKTILRKRTDELLAMPRDEFDALIEKHKDGWWARAIRCADTFDQDLPDAFEAAFTARGGHRDVLIDALAARYAPEDLAQVASDHFGRFGNEDRLAFVQRVFPDYEPASYDI